VRRRAQRPQALAYPRQRGHLQAIDNVLERFAKWSTAHAPFVRLARIRSGGKDGNRFLPTGSNIPGDTRDPWYRELKGLLENPEGIVLVGTTSHQIYNFVTNRNKENSTIAEYFDLIALDEGSQMDVGSSLPAVCAAANGARIIVAGDPMQLSPISSASKPVGAK
jgi:hypothetical protein